MFPLWLMCSTVTKVWLFVCRFQLCQCELHKGCCYIIFNLLLYIQECFINVSHTGIVLLMTAFCKKAGECLSLLLLLPAHDNKAGMMVVLINKIGQSLMLQIAAYLFQNRSKITHLNRNISTFCVYLLSCFGVHEDLTSYNTQFKLTDINKYPQIFKFELIFPGFLSPSC